MSRAYGKSDQDIDARLGESFSIELDANPTTGYEWEVLFDQKVIRLVNRRYLSAPAALGASNVESFSFEPIDAGDAVLRMRYKRRWEQTPIEEVIFHIHIKGGP